MSAMDLVSQLQQLSVGREDLPPVGTQVPLLANAHQTDGVAKTKTPYHPASLQRLLGPPASPSEQDGKLPATPKDKQVGFDLSSNTHVLYVPIR